MIHPSEINQRTCEIIQELLTISAGNVYIQLHTVLEVLSYRYSVRTFSDLGVPLHVIPVLELLNSLNRKVIATTCTNHPITY